MERIRNILTASMLLIAASAVAQLETLVEAVETAPSNIILPASSNGMMTFRPCDADCDEEHRRVLVTPETRFSVDGKSAKFDEFRRAFALIKQSDTSYALVSYDTKTNTLMSLEVTR